MTLEDVQTKEEAIEEVKKKLLNDPRYIYMWDTVENTFKNELSIALRELFQLDEEEKADLRKFEEKLYVLNSYLNRLNNLEIYSMELHDKVRIFSTGQEVVRVHGGWIYDQSVFVPYTNKVDPSNIEPEKEKLSRLVREIEEELKGMI